MIWWSRLRAAAGPNPDPKDDINEPDEELIPMPAVPKVWLSFCVAGRHLKPSKYHDPLRVILEYITEVRAVRTARDLLFFCAFGANMLCIGETWLRYGHCS